MMQQPASEVAQLTDLLAEAERERELTADAWTGKRAHPRRAISVPVSLRPLSNGSTEPVIEYLQNVSESGIGVFSHTEFQARQLVHVQIEVNGVCWGGSMRVVHCTPTLGGYKVGLEMENRQAGGENSNAAVADSSASWKPAEPQDDDSWLLKARDDIARAVQAYQLARRTWGVLGKSVHRQLKAIIEQIAGEPVPSVDQDRRKETRHRINLTANVFVHSVPRWRQFPVRLLDISSGGVQAMVLTRPDDPVERELAGEIQFREGMPVVVSVGLEPDILYVPAEIVRCGASDNGDLQLGLQFNTAAALAAFR